MDRNEILDKFRNITIKKLDNLYGQVCCDGEIMTGLMKKFAIEVPNARFMTKVKAGVWDGKIRFINYGGKFPIGLFKDVRKTLIEWNENLPKEEKKVIRTDKKFNIMEEINDLESVTHEYMNTGEKNKHISEDGEEFWFPHDYQWDLVKKAIENKQCIIESATSSGKTLMLGMICNYLLRTEKIKKILVIVPKIDLVVQGQKDLIDYGIPPEFIGMVFGGIKEFGKAITISTWQSMDLNDIEFFQQFECVVCDEVHGAKSSSKGGEIKSKKSDKTIMRQIIDLCTNCEYRIGLTGTLPTEKVDLFTIIGGFGPVVGKIKAKELMEKNHISKLKIYVPLLQHPSNAKEQIEKLTDTRLQEAGKGTLAEVKKSNSTIIVGEHYNAENEYLMRSVQRNKFICKVVKKRLQKKENILILIEKQEHGKIVKRILDRFCPEASHIFYIDGEVNIKHRKETREITENEDSVITIATLGVYSTGISINKLHTIIFFSGGKAKIRTLQAVGRSLRKHKTKKRALLIDVCDDLKYSLKHAKERLNFYNEEKHDVSFKDYILKEDNGII